MKTQSVGRHGSVWASSALLSALLSACAGHALAQPLVRLNPVAPDTSITISSVSGDGSTVVGNTSASLISIGIWNSTTGVGTRVPAPLPPGSGLQNFEGRDISFNGSVIVGIARDLGFTATRGYRLVLPSSGTNLGLFPLGTFLYPESVSDNGAVVSGWASLNSSGTQQTVWRWTTANPVLTAIPAPGGGISNNNGLQFSRYMSRSGRFIAVAQSVLDTSTNTYTPLASFPNPGGPPFTIEGPLSISDAGVAVGAAERDDPLFGITSFPVRWVNGAIEEIRNGTTPLPDSRVRAISADGRTMLITPLNTGQAKIWREGEGVRDLIPYMQSLGIVTTGITSFDPRAVSNDGRVVVGRMSISGVGSRGFALHLPAINACDSLDFNRDGFTPDSGDLDDFLAVLAGGPTACSTFPTPGCNDLDFNNDGLFPDSGDLDAFLSRLGGGPCL